MGPLKPTHTDAFWQRKREQERKERAEMGIDLAKYTESKWIKADDIGESVFPVTIRDVTEEKIFSQRSNQDEMVCVIWFDKSDKGLIPAKMNLQDIVARLGTDTDTWRGRHGELYTERTSFGPGARLRITDGPATQTPNQEPIKTHPVQGTPPWEKSNPAPAAEPDTHAEFTNENLTPEDDLPF